MLAITRQVKQREGCCADNIPEDVLLSTEPLVLRGLVADWPIVALARQSTQKATAYIEQFYSGEPVTAYLGAADIEGRPFYNSDFSGFNFERCRIDLKQVFAQLYEHSEQLRPPTFYVGSTLVNNWLPGFRKHNDLALDHYDPLVSLWVGNRSQVSAHWDFPTNIACTVVGRRRFILFPPDQLENLYVGPLDFTPSGQSISLVKFSDPDFERFPKFRQALKTAQVVEMAPGDALLLPSMWWHHVEALDSINVMVNYWWRHTPSFMGAPLNALQHAIMSLRDLPADQRRAWQQIFDHYVFNSQAKNFQHIPDTALGVLKTLNATTAEQIRSLLLKKLKR